MARRTYPLFLALIAGFWLAVPAFAVESAGKKMDSAAAGSKCLVAEVNPVTGSVNCIKPLGAPVEPPPTTDAPCTQDPRLKGQWTWGPNCKP